MTPEPLRDPTINYVVLAIAVMLEGTSWTIAVREFNARRGKGGWWQDILRSKDPASFMVLFEDSAALLGLLVAGVGIWLSHQLGDPRVDGMASIVIGLILACVAVLLAREAKGLLIGESADPQLIRTIWAIVESQPEVMAVNHVRTIHTSPDSVFVAISADFADDLPMGQAEKLIAMLESRLKDAIPQLSSIYIRPQRREDAVITHRPD